MNGDVPRDMADKPACGKTARIRHRDLIQIMEVRFVLAVSLPLVCACVYVERKANVPEDVDLEFHNKTSAGCESTGLCESGSSKKELCGKVM